MKIVKKIFKGFLIGIGVLLALMAILVVGTYIYNKAGLAKEEKLIEHKGQYVEVDGRRMNLSIEGEGEKTLVLLAGSGTPSPYLDFKPLVDELKDTYKVVVIERFGYGYSDGIEGNRTIDIITEQDREALSKAGVEGPYILCPHSASGLEAIYWAEHYPEEVEGVVGLDMAIPEQYDLMGVDWDNVEYMGAEECEDQVGFMYFWLYNMGFMRYYNMSEIFPGTVSDYLTNDEKAEYKAITYKMYGEGLDATYLHEQWIDDKQAGLLKELSENPKPDIPMLMFVTNDKNLAMQYGTAEAWKEIHENYVSALSDGKLVEIDGCHYFYTEIPGETAEYIDEFIDGLE